MSDLMTSVCLVVAASVLNLTQSSSHPPSDQILSSTSVFLIIGSGLALIIFTDLVAYKRYHKGGIYLHYVKHIMLVM